MVLLSLLTIDSFFNPLIMGGLLVNNEFVFLVLYSSKLFLNSTLFSEIFLELFFDNFLIPVFVVLIKLELISLFDLLGSIGDHELNIFDILLLLVWKEFILLFLLIVLLLIVLILLLLLLTFSFSFSFSNSWISLFSFFISLSINASFSLIFSCSFPLSLIWESNFIS